MCFSSTDQQLLMDFKLLGKSLTRGRQNVTGRHMVTLGLKAS